MTMIDRRNVLVFIFVKSPFKVLLMKRADFPVGVWQPVSGGIEEGEKQLQTVIREVSEETGIIDYLDIIDLDYSFTFTVISSNRFMKDYCYAMEIKNDNEILLSHEHYEYKWCIFSDALDILTFEENKKALQLLHDKIYDVEKYISNLCRYSALPLYKELRQNNSSIRVIHNTDFKQDFLLKNTDHKRFFRISHNLENVREVRITGYNIRKFNAETDIDKVINIINESYTDIKITKKEVIQMLKDKVYNSDLWKFVIDKSTNKEVALGICQFDASVFEVEFDWIQVLPEYRGKGIGLMLVSHLLNNTPKNAKFATVSGNIDNPSSPEKLYRNCGFVGNDVWHILIKSK